MGGVLEALTHHRAGMGVLPSAGSVSGESSSTQPHRALGNGSTTLGQGTAPDSTGRATQRHEDHEAPQGKPFLSCFADQALALILARPTSLSVRRNENLEGSGMDAGASKGQPILPKTGEMHAEGENSWANGEPRMPGLRQWGQCGVSYIGALLNRWGTGGGQASALGVLTQTLVSPNPFPGRMVSPGNRTQSSALP